MMLLKACASIIITTLMFSAVTKAEKLDLESQTILINKIEATLEKLKPGDKSVDQLGLKAQLANLYSEQARLLFIEEGKLDCNGCQGSLKMRQKSVKLYKEVIPFLEGDFKAGVALQLAHLYEMADQSNAAVLLYDEIIRNSKNDFSKIYVGKAFINRGNAHFRKGEFIPAQSDFRAALVLVRPEEKGSVLHKIAWTYYNQGEIATAIAQMKILLSQPKYLQQISSGGMQYSESLHSELAHDLALFMAKSEVNSEEIKQLVKLTPEASRIDNLLFLGDECDRLDNASGAIKVWQFALLLPEFPNEKKSIVRVKTARFYRERKQFDSAFREFHQSLEDQLQCKTESCNEYPPLAKNYLTSWDKVIKARSKTVNGESARALLRSYQDYNNHFQSEIQTLIWQAQLARDIDSKLLAMQTYHQAADLSSAQKNTKLTEESLVAEIDLAEKLNGPQGKIQAYNHYIALSPRGSHIWVVKFALGNTNYDLKKFQEAAEIYNLIAHQCNCRNGKDSIALKSAHLELDCLAKVDQPEKIEIAAKDYAVLYPKDRMVFFKIARSAGLKLAYRLVASKESDDVINAIKKMNSIPMIGANKEEKYSYYQLKMQLDELVLNFDSAYGISLTLGLDQSKKVEDVVKVLTLAELSGNATNRLIDKIISMKSPIADKKIAFVLKIRKATNPWPLIEKYSGVLRMDREMYSDLLIESFSRTKNFAAIEKYTKDSSIIKTNNGVTLWRLVFLKKLGVDAQSIQAARLISSSDRLLGVSLKKRLNLLKELQQKVRKADHMKDWSAQVISRAIYRTENIRLANEIQKLPIPKFLKASEKEQYRNGLVGQARPFINEAVTISNQMDDFWKDVQAIDALVTDIRTQAGYRMLFISEAKAVSAYAPDNVKSQLAAAINESPSVPSDKQLKSARDEVSLDPYNAGAMDDLINLEKAAGHKMMVAYLEGRRHFISQVGVVKR
jgi:hypothetical protein